MEIKPGIYEHFKGMKMKVIGIAKHSETLEDYVVYDHMGTDARSELWVRPLEMFVQEVEVNGQMVPRFKYVGEE